MKIVLILPPIENKVKFLEGWQLKSSDYGSFPPLGLLYIGTVLQQNVPGIELKIIDCPSQNISHEGLKDIINDFNPDVVGITVFSLCLVDVLKVARLAKSINHRVHVCLGGPHLSVYPAQTLAYPEVDSIVIGEGEYVFSELAKQLKAKNKIVSIDGLYTKDNIGNRDFKKAVVADLNKLPFFDIGLIDRKYYYSTVGRYRNIITLLSARGCPYQCTFCDTPYKVFRGRDIANILEEIKLRLSQGYQEIFFYDDTFNITPQRVIDLCNRILKEGVKFSWSFRGRINTANLEMLKIAKKAGCRRIHFGIETATDSGLKELKKGITIEQIKNIFYWCNRLKIKTIADFIIGLPFEKSRKDVLDNVQRLISFSPYFAQFNVLQPIPGSEIYSSGIKQGIIDPEAWDGFVRSPSIKFQPPLWTRYLNKEQLGELLYLSYRKFYIRPGCILKNVFSMGTFSELKRVLGGGLKILLRRNV